MDQAHTEDPPQERGSLAGSQEALIGRTAPGRSSNARAFKVAGLTTLACLLVASQVFTAYMVFNQNTQIHNLRKDSEMMAKQMTRRSLAGSPVRVPMNRAPAMMDLTLDEFDDDTTTQPPVPKPGDNPVVSMEKQLMDLRQFNGTFLANLQSLKQQMNESEWKDFEAWMSQQLMPAPPTAVPASPTKTKCQMDAESGTRKLGTYKPQCDEQGRYLPMQCWHSTGFCWCVDPEGTHIPGTQMRGHPDCQRARRQGMLASRLIQTLQDD